MAEGKDLLAGDTSSGGGRDLLATPKAPVYESPGALEKAGATAYGLGTSILGTGGDIEQALYPTEAKGEGALKGHSTFFPTTEEAQEIYGKFGIPKPRKEVSGYQKAGELLPAIAGGGKLAYDLTKAGVKGIGKLIGGGKDLAAELQATTAGKTAEEIEKAGKKATTAEKRAGATEKIAEREAGKSEAAYGQLPGVENKIAEADVTIGQRLKAKADDIYNKLKSTRAENAERLKADAFDFSKKKELAGERVENTKAYKDVLNEIDSLLNDKETGLAVSTLDAMKNPLLQIRRAIDPRYVDEASGIVMGRPISFKGMEELRRFLRDRSYGLPAEGFDAINQQKAGDLAKAVEKVMSDFSEKRIDKFINQYRQDSAPLQAFQSKLGKSLVGEQKGTTIATTAAQDIPKAVFKNKENFDNFVDAIGGDRKLAQAEAQKYFAGQLQGKDASQARKFIDDRNTRAMLKETGSYDMANNYVRQLEQAEKRGTTALERGKARAATAEEQRKLQSKLQKVESDINRADVYTDPARKIKYINDKAEELANLLPLEQRDQFLREVQSVVSAEEKKQKIIKWTKIGIGLGIGYGASHVASGFLGK